MNIKTGQKNPNFMDDHDRLEFYKCKAEEAYDRIYDTHSETEATAAYSDCKEFMRDAIRLARKLGLKVEAARLEERISHIKAVFRGSLAVIIEPIMCSRPLMEGLSLQGGLRYGIEKLCDLVNNKNSKYKKQ